MSDKTLVALTPREELDAERQEAVRLLEAPRRLNGEGSPPRGGELSLAITEFEVGLLWPREAREKGGQP